MSDFARGLFKENPIFVMVIGLCPALAITDKVVNALGMGVAVLVVLIGANAFASSLRRYIAEKARIPLYTLVVAGMVTVIDLLMQAYTPRLYSNLGIYAKLIVVNCLILGRAEAFAAKNSVGRSIADALGMGLGFTLSLALIALVREILGSGTITLFPIGTFAGTVEVPLLSQSPVRVLSLAAGALLVFGYLRAFFNWYRLRSRTKGRDVEDATTEISTG